MYSLPNERGSRVDLGLGLALFLHCIVALGVITIIHILFEKGKQ